MATRDLALINWGAIRGEMTGALTVLVLAVIGVVIWAAVSGNIRKVVLIVGGVLGAGVVATLLGLVVNPAATQSMFGNFFN